MTVATTTRRADALGNGAAKVYPFAFRILSADDLLVSVEDTAGTLYTLARTTDYTVSGVGAYAGGSITLVDNDQAWLDAEGDLKTDYRITIRRRLTITQLTDLRNRGGFFPEDHETAFDRLTMIALQQQDEIDRSIKFPETDDTGIAATLPAASARASKFVAFDANGNVMASVGNGVPATAFMATVLDDPDAATARATLGVTLANLGVSAFIQTLLDDASLEAATDTLTALPEVANMATLRELAWANGRRVRLRCHTNAGDGGHGVFRRVTGAAPGTYTHNGGTVLVAAAGDGSAAWLRELDGAWYNLRWFGAQGDGVADDTAAIQATLDAVHANAAGGAWAPAGTYLTGNINWPGNNMTLRGAGSGYSYNSAETVRTIFQAKAGTTIVFDLVQTGIAEDRTGNHLVDFEVHGNGIAQKGIECVGANIIERVHVRSCTIAGMALSNFTNSTRIVRCGFTQNSGYGLQVDGVSTTTFSVTDSKFALNTAGGINLEAGVVGKFMNCVIESNNGPGLRIYRPDTHTGAFQQIDFDSCWFEANGATAPNYTLVIDAQTVSEANAPSRIRFTKCRINPSVATRKHMNLNCAKWVTFEDCAFDASTDANALTLAANAYYVAFINSANAPGFTGLSATQLDNAIAGGTKCWHHDVDIKRVVGAGAPAAAFQNSWANLGGSAATAKYWFDREGSLHIQGTIAGGASGTVAFTLPAGYWPTQDHRYVVDANNGHGLVTVTTTGTVTVTVGSTTATYFGEIVVPLH